MLPEDQYEGAVNAAKTCDICFSVGTSAVVFPAAYIPIYAKNSGAFLVEINPNPTELSRMANVVLQGKSGEIFPLIVEEFKKRKNL
jgi:NAD-dependent deacetylase